MYAIQSTIDPSDWWSNRFGWTEKPQRDLFPEEEREQSGLRLPMDGQWVEADPNEEVTPVDFAFTSDPALRQPSPWDHPALPDWRYAVANGDTLRSFVEWLEHEGANDEAD